MKKGPLRSALIALVPLALVAALIAYANKTNANPFVNNPSAGGGSGGGGSSSGGGSSAAGPVYPLQLGSTGAQVKVLQGFLGVTQDGIFGPATAAALNALYCMSTVPDQATMNYIASFKGLPANCVPSNPAVSVVPGDSFGPSYDESTGLTSF